MTRRNKKPSAQEVSLSDIADALAYCEHEFDVDKIGGISGAMWVEGFAYTWRREWAPWELHRARHCQEQLTGAKWESLARQGRELASRFMG